ncbi:MAG: hypothetical protein KGD57_07500 [Candidatus Lokiarchaeota archaeon]|nr:hypothetical protein [Candidatus Lokiarchaeota archaeon]
MGEDIFLALNQLFDSIGIIEKGIERLYHYLLLNKRIDNLKEVSIQFNLTLKRGYKICSVLSDLELVQIYDRPMKIILQTPVIPIWQRLINNRIEVLKNRLNEQVDYCDDTFEKFTKIYDLKKDEVEQEPVEFISYSLDHIEDLFYPFLANKECKIAIGIRYENILISSIKNEPIDNIHQKFKDKFFKAINSIISNLQNINIQVIFNQEIIDQLLKSREYRIITSILEKVDFNFKTFDVRITEEDFSNFSLIGDELVQPSFDPSNKLMGAYISRNKNIYDIFDDKFIEIFKTGTPINQFIEQNKDLNSESLSEFQSFVLCLL